MSPHLQASSMGIVVLLFWGGGFWGRGVFCLLLYPHPRGLAWRQAPGEC